jgi:hypothetical protein
MKWQEAKIPVGRFMVPTQIAYEDGRIFWKFPYNKTLLEATKSFEGRKWHGYDDPPTKMWSFKDSSRNRFRFMKLQGIDVFKPWDIPLIEHKIPERHLLAKHKPWVHQIELFNHVLTRKQSIIVGDMGVGKSRIAIMVLEYLETHENISHDDMWFVGPVSAVNAFTREMRKWGYLANIKVFTHQKLVAFLEGYSGKAPKVLIADEASKLKNWATSRTKAVAHLAESMRYEHGLDCYIVEMSGTPAPKAPTDWWSLAEIARPGFLIESSAVKLRNTLCLIEERESAGGGMYPHIITWLDDSEKCATCGGKKEEHNEWSAHMFTPSVNQLSRLYNRLKGLVIIKRIDDCLELPDLTRRFIRVKPSMDTMRAASLIKSNKSIRAPQKLMLLKELSDGFQYQNVETGYKECERCHGTGKSLDYVRRDAPSEATLDVAFEAEYDTTEIECPRCEGTGQERNYEVQPIFVSTPKDAFLKYILDEYEDYGRFVIWGAFTATLNRITEQCLELGWTVLRIDGSGRFAHVPITEPPVDVETLMDCMDYSHPSHDELLRIYPKVVVVAHPKAGGMAYTFTAAPADLYYSNDFDGEAKIQSGARIRRGGMCLTRKVTSFELIHLQEDLMTIDNLDTKKNLQAVTLNDLTDYRFDESKTEFFDGETLT